MKVSTVENLRIIILILTCLTLTGSGLEYVYTNADVYESKNSEKYFLKARWKCIGPTPANMCGYGEVAGRVAFVKYDPSDYSGKIIYLGGAGGGLWKTTDGGNNWKPIADNLPSLSSGAFAIDPADSDVLYYGTGEGVDFTVSSYLGIGLFKSEDGGKTWRHIKKGLPVSDTKFYRIAIDPQNHGHLFAAMNSGLYRSTNEGNSWKIVKGTEGLQCTDVIFSYDNNMIYCVGPDTTYAYPGTGYRVSTDGGESFRLIQDANFRPSFRTHLAVSESNPGIVYAVTNFKNAYVYFYKSTNRGFNFSTPKSVENAYIQTNYNLFIFVSPYDPNLVYIGTSNLNRSTDGGESFSLVAGYGTAIHPDFHYMDFHPSNPDKIIAANDGGVHSSDDRGTSWINLSHTLTLAQIYKFAVNPFNPSIIVAGIQDIGFQFKNPDTVSWRDVVCGGDGGNIVFSPSAPGYAAGIYSLGGSMIYSNDSGKSFNFSYLPGMWDNNHDWIAPVAPHPTEGEIFYSARRNDSASYINFFTSTDGGISWETDSLHRIFDGGSPQQIAVSKSNPDVIYLSVGSCVDPGLKQNLFKSTNGGSGWKFVMDMHTVVPNTQVTKCAVDPDDENVVYVTFSASHAFGSEGKIIMSQNGGNTWSDVSGNLPGLPINDVIVLSLSQGEKKLIAACTPGVYIGNPSGNSYKWVMLAPGLPNCVVSQLDFNASSGLLRAATFGRGVWEINLTLK